MKKVTHVGLEPTTFAYFGLSFNVSFYRAQPTGNRSNTFNGQLTTRNAEKSFNGRDSNPKLSHNNRMRRSTDWANESLLIKSLLIQCFVV